ncbi:natterin-4-like [Hylaeus anthracinus]|uniref:natterin-4-like n=1 Tax=Hylaeus anthracinus TaxID=313031 RepID=UPI0023BA3512|nr:natterin-4-like [Hylaeus anthracinus]
MTGYKWVPFTGARHVVPEMIKVGQDLDGCTLVVGRASHHGDILPAKVKPEHGVAYVCYEGREHMKHDFEILMPAEFRWVHSGHGRVPENAVEAGRTVQGEVLYVGRAYHNGIPCMGKIHRSHGVLYVPYEGREISYRDYEVLVQY